MRKDETTNDAAKRAHARSKAGGAAPDVRGDDRTRAEVKKEQKDAHLGHLVPHAGHAAYEAAHVAEVHVVHALEAKVGGMLGLGAAGTAAAFTGGVGAAGGMILGYFEIKEAHANGKAQREALAKEQVHVAVIAALDLPPGHKAQRLDAHGDTPRGHGSAAFKITEALVSDPRAIAVLQMHCDRGITAGLDYRASGQTKEAFLAAHPEVARRRAADVAFKEGFDAATACEGKELDTLKAGLAARTPKYACAEVRMRG